MNDGVAAFSSLVFGFVEMLVVVETSASPLVEEVVIRAFRINPALGYLVVGAQALFIFSMLLRCLRVVRRLDNDIAFKEVFKADTNDKVPTAEWHYSGTIDQIWLPPAGDTHTRVASR